jgi:hypothetical protein
MGRARHPGKIGGASANQPALKDIIMPRPIKKIARFAELLAADAKLADAHASLTRAGLEKDGARISTLRLAVARAMQSLQDSVYEGIRAE